MTKFPFLINKKYDVLSGEMAIVLATGTKVHRFKPCRG
jgi:hypothetical protein